MKTLILGLALAAVTVSWGQEAKKNPLLGNKAALEAGQKRFGEGCAACHGPEAQGGRGPALVQNRDIQRMTDEQLFSTIQHGIPGTGMPPSQLPEPQIAQLAAFVRSLSSPAVMAAVSGDPDAGRSFYYGQGQCTTCHAIRGKGGLLGPDLTNAGAEMTVGELRQSMLDPSARIPHGFEAVSVKLRDGRSIKGVAKDETNYGIDILDKEGHLNLLSPSQIVSVSFEKDSLMPSYKSAGDAEIDNVIAFLAQQTLRPVGEQTGRRRWQEIH